MVLGLKWDKQSSGGTKYVLGVRVLDASIHLSKDSLENTVTPKTVPMFGSFVVHIKWCM